MNNNEYIIYFYNNNICIIGKQNKKFAVEIKTKKTTAKNLIKRNKQITEQEAKKILADIDAW